MLKTDLTVVGVDKLLRELNAFDKDAQKVLRRDIRDAVDVIRDEAASSLPDQVLRNYGRWIAKKDGRDLSWQVGSARSGLKKSASLKKSGGVYGVTGLVVNKSPITAIFAVAGSRSSSPFSTKIRQRYGSGPWPRALGPSWRNNVDKVRNLIEDAIVKAADAIGR